VTQTYFGDEGVVLMTVNEVREVTLGEVERKQVKRGEGGVAGDVPQMLKGAIQVAMWNTWRENEVEDRTREGEGRKKCG
jgi:hypothetical protein